MVSKVVIVSPVVGSTTAQFVVLIRDSPRCPLVFKD